MRSRLTILLLLLLVCSEAALGQADGQWRKDLDLAELKLGKVTLLYEKSMAAQAKEFKGFWPKLLEAQSKRISQARALKGKADDIARDLAGIVTISERQAEQIKAALVSSERLFGTAAFGMEGQTVCLLTKSTGKNYLAKGGTIPNLGYNAATDKLECRVFVPYTTAKPAMAPGKDATVIPLALLDPNSLRYRESLDGLLAVQESFGGLIFSMLHEVAELAIIMRLRPSDPWFRWFTDGFANVLAEHLAKKHMDKATAKEFAGMIQDWRQYTDLEKDINLRYWMGSGYFLETPLKSEKRLEQARYAYATLEARRLVDKHGLGCLDKILDKACKADRNPSRGLSAAIKAVTGENMEARLDRYQKFDNPKEAIKTCVNQFVINVNARDYAKALPPVLRTIEIKQNRDSLCYAMVIHLLYAMKEDAAADKALNKMLTKIIGPNDPKGRLHFKKAFVYAATCEWPLLAKAHDIAEEVLKQDPQNTSALRIRADRLRSEGRIKEANSVMTRIAKLEAQRAKQSQ